MAHARKKKSKSKPIETTDQAHGILQPIAPPPYSQSSNADANLMASSSRAFSMRAHPKEERTEDEYRDRDSKAKTSARNSRHRKSLESSHKHRARPEDTGREGRGHRKNSERKSKHRSRSRGSRHDYYTGGGDHRDYHPRYESSRDKTYPDRKYHREYQDEYQRSSKEAGSNRRHYDEESRSYRPSAQDPYSSRSTRDEYYDQYYHKSDRRREDRTGADTDQDRQHSDYHHHRSERRRGEAASPHRRRSRSDDRAERISDKEQRYYSSRSASPEADFDSSTGEKLSRSAKRSDKQKSRTLRHLQARKATTDFFRRLSASPHREKSADLDDRAGHQHTSKEANDTVNAYRSPDSSDASVHRGQASDMNSGNHTPRHGPAPIDTRHQYSGHPSQYGTPTYGSHHGSPQLTSPYGRGGWGGGHHHYSANAYSPHRQNSYPGTQHVDAQYYQNAQYHGHGAPQQQGYYSPSYPNSGHPNGHAYSNNDRRYSGGQTSPLNPNGNAQQGLSQTPVLQASSSNKQSSNEDDNPFRPPKNLRAEDEGPTSITSKDSTAEQSNNVSGSGGSKISFAFKAKAPAPIAKPIPDLSQKMKEPKKENVMELDKPKASAAVPVPVASAEISTQSETSVPKESLRNGPHGPKERNHQREPPREPYRDPYGRSRDERYHDPYERERHGQAYDEHYRDDRYYERGYHNDQREYYEGSREHRRDPRDYHGPRTDDQRRSDHDRRQGEKGSRRKQEQEHKSRSKPEMIIVKKKMTRILPRPVLSEEHAQSDSVYFRGKGNESVIGAGTYGKVFRAVHVYTKEQVALKKIRMEGERDGFPVTAVREVKLLQSLHHPNVVRLLEVMVENNDCYMVFEYASHDLTGLLNHPSFYLSAAHKKHLIKQLFEGLDYLHRRGVLHRDIKAANILVTNKGELKLADFGLARFYKKHKVQDYTNRVITIWYRPPELLLGETQYGAAVDIWSAACVMMEVFTKHAIFPGDGHEINQLEKVYNMLGTPTLEEWPGMKELAWFDFLRPVVKKPSVFADKYRERLTPQAFDLMQALFVYDPKKRPTAEYVLMHPYFTTEEPAPAQAVELADLQGDWHEFESKALRRKKEQRDRDARMKQAQEEQHKRKAAALEGPTETGPDPKRTRPSTMSRADGEVQVAAD